MIPLEAYVSAITAGLLLAGFSGAQSEQPDRTCAIDMGSNTFRRIVASFHGGRYTAFSIDKKTLGVGDDVARNGRVSDAKIAEIEATLAAFKAACVTDGLPRVIAVGTAAFRDAANGARIVAVARAHGIAMEIASEARESELAYLAGSLGEDGVAVIDNGSRTIELVAQEAGARQHAVLKHGYRIAYQAFFAPADQAVAAVDAFRATLAREAATAAFMRGRKRIVGVEFGDMSEVFFPGAPPGGVLTASALRAKLHEVMQLDAEEFAALKRRADIDRALPRLVAAAVLVEAFGYKEIEMTERELGTGLIIEAGLRGR